MMNESIVELSEDTKRRFIDLQKKMKSDDVDETANTAIDLLETLIDMGGEAQLIDDSTGKGFKVSVR